MQTTRCLARKTHIAENFTSLQTLLTAALTLTLAWYIAYWYVNKRGVMVGAGAAVAKADKDEAIRDEFEEAAATPVGLAG